MVMGVREWGTKAIPLGNFPNMKYDFYTGEWVVGGWAGLSCDKGL